MPSFDLIAFDADDTLWQNEVLYRDAQAKFFRILSAYHPQAWIEARLYDTEMRNLDHFGYGIKAFVLSMIETAIELTEGRISGREIGEIIEAGKFMLNSPPALIHGVEPVLQALAPACPLIVITKGDLLDQEAKIARSGLAGYFQGVEIVSGKSSATYRAILDRYGAAPRRFLMVGNSLRSDILPVLEIGGWAAYIPHPLTWAHENEVQGELRSERLVELAQIADLPGAIEKLRRLPPAAGG
jgi:putative hydrolase of the HAD superfamily